MHANLVTYYFDCEHYEKCKTKYFFLFFYFSDRRRPSIPALEQEEDELPWVMYKKMKTLDEEEKDKENEDDNDDENDSDDNDSKFGMRVC